MAVSATTEKGELVIRLPLNKPTKSTSGKTMLVGTTNGFVQTTATVKVGEEAVPIRISVNATIPAR